MLNKHYRIILIFLLPILISFGCAQKEPVLGDDNKPKEINPFEKARAAARSGEGIFGDINQSKRSSTTFEFSTSNVLWRATLQSLDFLPLVNADYSGGVIIYDWYSNENSNEQIKVTVRFLNNELRSDSVKITAHKKICDSSDRCSNSTLDQNFANSVKENIIASARALKIEEAKKEKK